MHTSLYLESEVIEDVKPIKINGRIIKWHAFNGQTNPVLSSRLSTEFEMCARPHSMQFAGGGSRKFNP